MNNREKLREWFNAQRKEGLKDVKVFPGESSDLSVEQVAARVLSIVSGGCQSVDVTDELP